MHLSLQGERELLSVLEKAGLTFQAAAAMIQDPKLAKEFVEAGSEKIKGRHRLLR